MLKTIMRKLGWVPAHELHEVNFQKGVEIQALRNTQVQTDLAHARLYLELGEKLVQAREDLWQRKLPHSLLKLEREYQAEIAKMKEEKY